jgi:YVTN family beta-propeller protein
VSTGEIPCAVAVDDSSGKAFVANFASNDVTVLDGASDTVVGTMSVGPKPQAIAVDSNNHKVYVVSTHERTVTVLDGHNNSVLGTVRMEKRPFAIAVNSQTHVAAVLNLDGDVTLIDGTTMATSSLSLPKDQR